MYPQSLDSFTDPLPTNKLNNPSHSAIETAQNTALEQIELYLGIVGTVSTTSITYAVKSSSSVDPGHHHTSASFNGSFPTSGLSGTLPASALVGTFPTTAVTFPTSSIPASSFYGTFPTTSLSYPASSIPASTIYGVLPASVIQFKNGTATRAGNTASSAQNIAHGLTTTPKKVKLTVNYGGTNVADVQVQSIGAYDGTNNSSSYWFQTTNNTSSNTGGVDTTHAVHMEVLTGGTNLGVVTVDATNIIITWTVTTGVGSNNMNILWEAEA